MKERIQVEKCDQWNVEAMYPNLQEWDKEYQTVVPKSVSPRWENLKKFQGTLGSSPENLLKAIEFIQALDRKLSKLYTFAHLKHDEDIGNEQNKIAYNQILSALYDFQNEISWFEPELVSLPETTIASLLKAPCLEPYRFYLEKIVRMKPHTLTKEAEELVSLTSKALGTSHKAFSALNDADLSFGKALDSQGKEWDITHASFRSLLQSQDRTLRENAFKTYHKVFSSYSNTLCELLSGQMQSHLFFAKSHHFPTCLDAALFPKNIDTSVYHSLIEAVNKGLPALHRYIGLRKKILNLPTIELWDMYVPLTKEVDIKLNYEQAEDVVIESVAPLGSKYQSTLAKGFKSDRWVDRYENKNKRSGAYSSGCYDSCPYILMNYKELLRDVFTLAHEAGHSMHSFLSHANQPYQYGDYPIFLAEVASTFNEDLLTRHLLKNSTSTEEKVYLINQKIEDIRATLFRQTMFAEFELKIHQMAEENTPITPHLLNSCYRKLNEKYFGKEANIDSSGDIEWARIPHFYYNFYVYQYATGISAALALSDLVCQGGEKERENYLSFLKGGSSRYPIELLKMAGVDMTTPKPVISAIEKFDSLVGELETLLVNC